MFTLTERVAKMRARAESGDAEAQLFMGCLLKHGGVEQVEATPD